jgi:hypothetical protein
MPYITTSTAQHHTASRFTTAHAIILQRDCDHISLMNAASACNESARVEQHTIKSLVNSLIRC